MAKKFREVRKALHNAGWSVVRVTGSHERWSHPDGRHTTVAGKSNDDVSERYAGPDPTRDWIEGAAMNTYAVIYERADDGGWWARAAEFPVYSHGDTREEAEAEVKAGIAFHLEETLRAGEDLPPES